MGVPTVRLAAGDEPATKAIAAGLAALLGPGDVVGLTGDLGAGKTRFVQGAARALGVEDLVVSPTFMLVREYDGASMAVHHVDAYRLGGSAELEDLGLDEIFTDDAVVFIEWADRVAGALPESWLEIDLYALPDETRRLDLIPHGPAWVGRMGRVADALGAFAAA